MASLSLSGPVVCAWCAKELKGGNLQSPLSHGICLACMAASSGNPVEDLSHVSPDVLDALPFGAIQLSGDGVIVSYNRGESTLSGLAPEAVIGKNFFRDVAPCTAVRDFEGKFQALRATGKNGHTKLLFVFKFARGTKLVEIAIVYDAKTDVSTLLVKTVMSEPAL